MQRISLGNALKDQKGITGLETAIVLIAFVVVAAVFAFTVITTGLFSSEKAAETASAGLGEASTSLTPKGSTIASGNLGNDAVAIVRFKLANSGKQAVGLPAANTLVTYSDTSNLVTLERAADATGITATGPWWYSDWKLGTGESLDSGEIVEITVGLFTTVDSTTTINEGAVYAAGDVTLTVVSGAAFSAGDIIYVGSEQITVTSISTNDLTVVRGANGTTDAAHADGLTLYIVNSRLTTDLGTNEPFKIEMIPPEGAPFTLTRTSPIEIKAIMDLR
ncbi:MAG: hypothetical protein IIC27_00950 [Chloroflexi bacterium]|nr:hypothetical protein [Chloroflexota bacterium]